MNNQNLLPFTVINTLFIITTENCNSKCLTCSYGKYKDFKEIDYNKLIFIIKNLKSHGLKNIFLTGGEVLLYKDFEKLVNFIHNENLYLKVATNGINLNKSPMGIINKINFLVISLDSTTPDVYFKVRGTNNFEKIMDTITFLKAENRQIRLSFLIQKNNFIQIIDFFHFCLDHNIDSISYLVPNKNGMFGAEIFKQYDEKNIFLNHDELFLLENEISNKLSFLVEKYPNYTNLTKKKIGIYMDYLKSLNSKNNFSLGTFKRCSLPFDSLVILPDFSVKLCFFRKNKIPINAEEDILTNKDLLKERNDYFMFGSNRDICLSCLETYEVAAC